MNASAAASTPRSGVVSDASFLRALLAGAPEYLYFKDLSSRFIAVSDSLVRALGKSSRAEVLGRTDFDFYAPEHAQPRFDDEQEIARTGRPRNRP